MNLFESDDVLSLRDVLVIVVAGAALGTGFNALQLDADPSRALSWVKSERTLAKLQLESHTPPVAPVPEARAAAASGDTSRTAVAHDTTAVKPSPDPKHAKGKPAPDAKQAHAPAATTGKPATPAPGTPAPAAATTAPAAAATDLPAIPDSRSPAEASLDLIRRFHAAGAALILDARPADEYAEGHIAGALNVPFDDVFKNPDLVKTVDPKGRPIFTYCGGGDCELSRSLAFSLIDAGQRKVLVFTGGIPAWQAAGLPIHKGAQP